MCRVGSFALSKEMTDLRTHISPRTWFTMKSVMSAQTPHPGPGVGLAICPQSPSVCTLSTARGLNCNRLRHNFLPLQRPLVSGDAGEAVGISRAGLGQVDSGSVGIFCVLPSPSTKSQPAPPLQHPDRARESRGTSTRSVWPKGRDGGAQSQRLVRRMSPSCQMCGITSGEMPE